MAGRRADRLTPCLFRPLVSTSIEHQQEVHTLTLKEFLVLPAAALREALVQKTGSHYLNPLRFQPG